MNRTASSRQRQKGASRLVGATRDVARSRSRDERNCAQWFARFEEHREEPTGRSSRSEVRRLRKELEAMKWGGSLALGADEPVAQPCAGQRAAYRSVSAGRWAPSAADIRKMVHVATFMTGLGHPFTHVVLQISGEPEWCCPIQSQTVPANPTASNAIVGFFSGAFSGHTQGV